MVVGTTDNKATNYNAKCCKWNERINIRPEVTQQMGGLQIWETDLERELLPETVFQWSTDVF